MTTPFGSRRRRAKLPPVEHDEHGRTRCRTCHTPFTGRGVYCGPRCREEFLMRRRPEAAAAQIRKLDGYRCAGCGADELECFARYKQAAALLSGTPCEALLAPFVLWQNDHIRPVSDGGGECGPENFRLLCPTCHAGVTRVLMQDRKARKAAPSAWSAAARDARAYKQPLPQKETS